ncbi:hypothetical protein H0H87_007962 [Tephrocybe sp. NHM501043]|nr:hypothetical protein H0H87_007962 [Tephrocybe sp. NHM501043]
MRHLILAISLLPVLRGQTIPALLANVTQAFSQAQIVPDLLPSFAPEALVNVSFPPSVQDSRSAAVNVTPGVLLPENRTSVVPAMFLVANNTALVSNRTLLLALVDPDVPTPQDANRTEFLHFLGGNFSVDASSPNSTRLVNQSAALLEYMAPSPPAGSPPHRYVLLVYQVTTDVPSNIASLVNATTSRLGFNFTAFASAANLASPFAGNYFLVGSDNGTNTASSAAVPSPTSAITSQPTLTAPSSSSSTQTSAAAPTSSNSAMLSGPPTLENIPFILLAFLARELWGA